MLEANKKFVDDVKRSYETEEAAVAEGMKMAWHMFHRGDFETAMKRFNQVWLLTPENPEIFFGYSRILKALGYTADADHWARKAKAAGHDVPEAIP